MVQSSATAGEGGISWQNRRHNSSTISLYPRPMHLSLVDIAGLSGAALTTLCWLPQAWKIIRDHETRAISLPATSMFTAGVSLWLVYGVALKDVPLIASNIVTLALMLVILALKLRYG